MKRSKPFRWTKYRMILREFLEHPDCPRNIYDAWDKIEKGMRLQLERSSARPSEIAMAISSDRDEFFEVARRIGRAS